MLILLVLTGCDGITVGPPGTGGGGENSGTGGGSSTGTGGGVFGTGGGDTGTGGGVSGTGGGSVTSDLPCEVETVLKASCQSCHGATLANNAPMHLVTRDDLLAPSNIDPSSTMAERAVFRMRIPSAGRMPPLPNAAVATDAIDAFEGWITNGSQPGSCGGTGGGTSGTGGGTSGTGGGTSGTGGGTSGTGGGTSGTGGGSTGTGGGAAFIADPPAVYVAKVKNVLVGLPPTDAELAAVMANPTALGSLVDSWMTLPQYQSKMKRFFQLSFQQTQIAAVNFGDMLRRANLPLNAAPELVQNLQESFARTMLTLNAQNRPFTQALTTSQYSMTTALQTFYALRDVYEVDNNPNGSHDAFATANPGVNIVIRSTGGPIPLAQSIDPANANYMKWYDPNVAAACGSDPYTIPARANDLYLLLIGGRPGNCTANLAGQLTAADFNDWKMVTLRAPRTGEVITQFYDLPTMRSTTQTELLLQRPYVGFFTTPAFFANWMTNDSNQMRVTLNQTLIVATGAQIDGTDTTVPSSTPGLDSTHANNSACVYCHQTLDPSRSIFSATFSWNYGRQRDTRWSGQKGLFAFQGVEAPMNTIRDLGTVLSTHPLFQTAWPQKLCYWVNSQACRTDDPEFLRVAQLFKSSTWSWNALVKAIVTSPLVTHAAPTRTQTLDGTAIAVARRDHLCAEWNARLGFKDICGMDITVGSPLPFTGKQIIPGLPSDGYSRGGVAPVLPNSPSLFYRAGIENLCAQIAPMVVDATSPIAGVKQWTSAQPTAAIAEFVSLVAGIAPSDPRSTGLTSQLTQHYNTARAMSGVTATTALRSTFVVACMSPTAAAIGL